MSTNATSILGVGELNFLVLRQTANSASTCSMFSVGVGIGCPVVIKKHVIYQGEMT